MPFVSVVKTPPAAFNHEGHKAHEGTKGPAVVRSPRLHNGRLLRDTALMAKGRPPVQRSPGEKKALSYAKDRRNDYGQNDKASRKLIPKQKAAAHRIIRRRADRTLFGVSAVDDADLIETITTADIQHKTGSQRKGAWQKSPDAPLGEYLMKQRVRDARGRFRKVNARAERAAKS